MKTLRTIVIAALCGPLVCVCFAQVPAPPKGFDAYPMARTRNIFDPTRQPMVASQPASTVVAPKASDYVALTGIMFSGGNALAFFSGSRPDYDKVLPVNTQIAGAKLTGISPSGIEVERNGKKIVVAVGQSVPFDNSPPGLPPGSPGDADSAATPAAASPSLPPSLPANLNDVMRRMMERRQHDLQ